MSFVYKPEENKTSNGHIIVTGAAGFIGSHLVEKLLELGEHVIGIDDFDPWYSPNQKRLNLHSAQKHRYFTLLETNLANLPEETFEGAKTIFHLAGRPGVQDSWGTGFVDCINRNTTDTQRVYENALAYGIEQVIYASSSSVYGSNDDALSNRIPQPISPYGVSKLAGEHLAGVYRERGLSITCLRYFTVFGPRQRPDMAIHRMFEATRPGGSTFVKRGSGEQRREFTFVNDVVEATIIASKTASAANATLDIGGGFSVSLNELATSIQNISELEMRLSSIPQTAGDPYTTVANLNQTCDTIEWHPTTTLEQGLEAQWLWHFPSSDDVLHHVPIAEIVKNTPHTQVRT